jgi:hypothetical protein
LTTNDGRDKLSILASIAWHDVRYFLELLRDLHSQLGSETTPWGLLEIIATLTTPFGFGNILPVISNIYRPPFPTYNCYFLKLRILLMLMYGIKEHQVNYGVPFDKILNFARLYGYQRRWVERAIEEMVQSRFLECLEIPSEREYRKDYRLHKSHTFRRSPLAVVLVQTIVSQPIYLSITGNDLPYHKPSVFETYKTALKEILDTLDESKLERDAIDLLTNGNMLVQTVSQYLLDIFKEEQAPQNLLSYIPELGTTERRLEEIINVLKTYAGKINNSESLSDGRPSPLFDMEIFEAQQSLIKELPIPPNLNEVKIGNSSLGVLVLWAMVALKKVGRNTVTGAEITEVINKFLVDDYHQKQAASVLRSLRQPTLQSQDWLITRPGPKYSLSDEWERYWIKLFNETVPEVKSVG